MFYGYIDDVKLNVVERADDGYRNMQKFEAVLKKQGFELDQPRSQDKFRIRDGGPSRLESIICTSGIARFHQRTGPSAKSKSKSFSPIRIRSPAMRPFTPTLSRRWRAPTFSSMTDTQATWKI